MTTISHPAPPPREREGARQLSLAGEIERLLAAGVGITVRALDETAQADDLTLAQWRVLVVADQLEGPRVGELAERLGMSVPSTSRLVRRAEARGLVTARRAEDDRRATIVSLTPRGAVFVKAVVTRRRDLVDQALREWDTSPLAETMAGLRAIADRLGSIA
jgi:DNA-binding MarR family transcriptional regulator